MGGRRWKIIMESCTTSIYGDGWADAKTPVHEIKLGPPEALRDGDYRGAHLSYGNNPDHPTGVPLGKYQKLMQYMVRELERAERQRHQERARRLWCQNVELRHQQAVVQATYDKENDDSDQDHWAAQASIDGRVEEAVCWPAMGPWSQFLGGKGIQLQAVFKDQHLGLHSQCRDCRRLPPYVGDPMHCPQHGPAKCRGACRHQSS